MANIGNLENGGAWPVNKVLEHTNYLLRNYKL